MRTVIARFFLFFNSCLGSSRRSIPRWRLIWRRHVWFDRRGLISMIRARLRFYFVCMHIPQTCRKSDPIKYFKTTTTKELAKNLKVTFQKYLITHKYQTSSDFASSNTKMYNPWYITTIQVNKVWTHFYIIINSPLLLLTLEDETFYTFFFLGAESFPEPFLTSWREGPGID